MSTPTPGPLDPIRVIRAAQFNISTALEMPFEGGRMAPESLKLLAEAASTLFKADVLLRDTPNRPEAVADAVKMALAIMWAAGFKTAVHAMSPENGA